MIPTSFLQSTLLLWLLPFLYSTISAQSYHQKGLHSQNTIHQTIKPPRFTNSKYFSSDDGISLENIRSIVIDTTGFVWIGGLGAGLLRFDGTHFTPIQINNKDGNLIDVIKLSLKTSDHQLIINTWGDGIYILDLSSYKYEQIDLASSNLSNFTYWTLREEDYYLIGTNQGLVRYNTIDSSFQHFSCQSLKDAVPANQLEWENNFISYHKDIANDSILWLGSGSGLVRFNLYTNVYQRFYYSPKTYKKLRNLNSIRLIHQLSDDALYLGTWGGGILKFDPHTQTFEHFLINEGKVGGENVILSIYPLLGNKLGVTTNLGFVYFDPRTKRFANFLSNIPNKNKLLGIRYIDRKGNLYTWRKDLLNIYSSLSEQIKTYTLPLSDELNIQPQAKRSLSTEDQILIVGHESEGLYIYDEKRLDWKIIKPPQWDDEPLYIFDMIKLKNGEVLILENSKGIFRFDKESQELLPFKFPIPNIRQGFRRILQHSSGDLWISTQYDGAFKIDHKGEITNYKNQLQTYSSKVHFSGLGTLFEDSQGNIWISASSGYSVFDYKRDTFYNFPTISDNPLVDVINFIEDHEANIWIASHRHGIAKANVHQPNKAASHVIDYATIERKKAALGDQSGNIWLYSINGLERFDLKKNRITFYDKKYGFGQEAYGSNVLNDGRFFIGYQNTFSLFHPDSLNKSNDVPEPYITNFEVFNKPYVAAEQAVFLKKVNLDWRQNFFSIHFSNKNITLPELDTFAYQLEGIDPNWVYTTNTRFANYTDIASGQYTFKLKSANDNGVRTERPLELQINIATPWWKTWWFYSICSLVALALLRVVYQFQLKKKVAEQEAARLEELDQFKSRIYTNLTHEFRTPLTVIKGATETLKGRLRYKQDEQQLLTIQRNSDQILNLINQILELSKLEGGKQQIDWIQADILLFLKYLTDSFQSLAHQKHIALSFHSSKASLLMDFDKDKLQRIISNLISNALKFTPEYGQIQLSAELFNDASLQVKVSDTGKGIAKTNLSYIFDRFYQVEQSSYEGTGIGLALVKQLTELLEGNIEVKSEPEKGTTFLLNFPIHNNASLTTLAFQPTINIQASIFKETPLNDIEKPLLLLIDDNYDILQYLTKILSFHYQIETARNGQQGIQKALVANPKLILCDVMMPEKDGFEVCETLKNDARTKHIPIILLTARADQEDLIHGLSVQANAYLKKPFDKKELLLTIENLLCNNSALYSPFQEKATPFLEQFKGLVKEHLSDDRLSIELLRRQLHLSRNALNEKIKTATGMTTMQYVKNLRLLHAYYLLQTGNHTVKEVQYECGFPSASAFSQAFKEKFGLPPSEVKYV